MPSQKLRKNNSIRARKLKNKIHNKKTRKSKKQNGGADNNCDNVANVLIVVDVQNCFIDGGSMGGPSKNAKLIEEIANITKNVKLDYVVLTRDMHPAHHHSHMFLSKTKGNVFMRDTSNGEIIEITEEEAFNRSIKYIEGITQGSKLETISGLWPPHCRATSKEVKNISRCAPKKYTKKIPPTEEGQPEMTEEMKEGETWDPETERNKEGRATSEITGIEKVGNDISYFFDEQKDITPLFRNFINPHMILGLEDVDGNQNNSPDNATFQLTIQKEVLKGEIPVLQLYKGQLCGYESYSAFMYHLKDEKNYLDVEPPADSYKHTTGLLEVLLSDQYGIARYKNGNITKINFIVCGLVGEVCIKYTIYYGYYLYNKFLQETTNFTKNLNRIKVNNPLIKKPIGKFDKKPQNLEKLTIASTIFKSIYTNFIYSIYGTRFLTSVDTTMGKTPLPPVLDSVKEELAKLNLFKNNNSNQQLNYKIDAETQKLKITQSGETNYTLDDFRNYIKTIGFSDCLTN